MSQPQWVSLYVQSGEGREAHLSAIATALEGAGGINYDPFGLMPGLSYPRATKLFAAPPTVRWLRLIVSPDSILEPVLKAAGSIVLMAVISGDLIPSIAVFEGGVPTETLPALTPYVSDAAAFAAHLNAPRAGAAGIGGVSSGALPDNVRAMSGGLPTRQVERLMNTMTGGISKGDRAGAQAALQIVDWGSGAGSWMRKLLSYLDLADSAALDFATVSTAYRTAKRLLRNPKATLYPGDAEARDAVTNALDYVPIFYGWRA